MKSLHLYTANTREDRKNTLYPNCRSVQSAEDFLRAVRNDYIGAEMKGSRRDRRNYQECDCILLDLDNTHSDDPDRWQDLDNLAEDLQDVPFYFCESRNSRKVKRKEARDGTISYESPRVKYHMVFPLGAPIRDRDECRKLLLRTVAFYPYFDIEAAKPEQVMFGVETPAGGYEDGDQCIDEFISSVTDEQLRERFVAYSENQVQDGRDDPRAMKEYKELRKVIGLKEQPKAKSKSQPQEKVEHGHGYKHVVSTIGHLVLKSGDVLDNDAILAAARADILKRYEYPERVEDPEDFKKLYGYTVEKFREEAEKANEDPDFYKYAVKAWRAENGGKKFNKNEVSWDEVAEAGLRARAEGRTFEKKGNKTRAPAKTPPMIPDGDEEDIQYPVLETNDQGEILKVFQNYVAVLRCKNECGRIRQNALSGRPEIDGAKWNIAPHAVRDNDLYNVRLYLSTYYGLSNKDNVRQAIDIVAHEATFHPVVEALQALQWDGVPRIADLFPRYLGAERSEYTTAVTTLLLHGAIQRVMNPGVKFDYCIILADSKQGTGKSSICRFLAIDDRWFVDELGDLGNSKAAYETIRGKWVCELGEMIATRKTKDIEQIKSYITRLADEYRTPYGTFSEDYPRQCVFIGTSNKPQFLPEDKTGNRRFLPVLCDGNKAERHPMEDEQETREYILQCYAEAIQLGNEDGWSLVLDHRYDEELDAIREASTAEDTKVGMIQEYLNKRSGPICTRMIFNDLFNPDQARTPQKFELQEIADIMNLKIVGWEKYRGKNGDNPRAKYKFPDIYVGRGITYQYGTQRAWIRSQEPGPEKLPPPQKSVATSGKTGEVATNEGFMDMPEGDESPFD